MKKNLFIGATLLFALIITGCPKSPDEPVQPKKEEVSVSDVKDSGAENSVKELKTDEIPNLFVSALTTQMSDEETQAALMESIQPFLKSILGGSEETENLNSRAVTVDKLENVYPELMKEYKNFLANISIGEGDSLPESGKLEKKATFDYSISPNGISYTDEKDVISIDVSKLNISTNEVTYSVNVDAEGEISEQTNGKVEVDAAAKGTIDFTKVEGLKDFVIREGILQVALNGNAAIDSTYNRKEEEVSVSGNLNAGLTASSVITVIIPEGDKKYGGKILSKASLNFDCNKIEDLNEPTLEDLGKYLTINITSDLYTDDGEKVCELLKITTLEELLKLFPSDVPGEDDSSEE